MCNVQCAMYNVQCAVYNDLKRQAAYYRLSHTLTQLFRKEVWGIHGQEFISDNHV